MLTLDDLNRKSDAFVTDGIVNWVNAYLAWDDSSVQADAATFEPAELLTVFSGSAVAPTASEDGCLTLSTLGVWINETITEGQERAPTTSLVCSAEWGDEEEASDDDEEEEEEEDEDFFTDDEDDLDDDEDEFDDAEENEE